MQNKRSCILEYNWARDSVSFDVWCLKQSNKKWTFLSTIAFVKGLKGCILGYLITLSETNTNWGRGGGQAGLIQKACNLLRRNKGETP